MSYEQKIKTAVLLATPADSVAQFLKERAQTAVAQTWNDPVSEEAERALLERGDPLITLSLAQFGRYDTILANLFRANKPGSAIRLAVLANRHASASPMTRFPLDILGSDDAILVWLADAPGDELAALFENPHIHNGFLRDLLERNAPWDQIPLERLKEIVQLLYRNERMWTPYDDSYMDGYAEYSHGAVFDAAWALAQRVPPTPAWADALQWLYTRLMPESTSMQDPLAVAERWRPPADDLAGQATESAAPGTWRNDGEQGVRTGLARLAIYRHPALAQTLLESEDRAFRYASYAHGQLAGEQLLSARVRDGGTVFEHAVTNEFLWRTASGRRVLHDLAWASENSHLDDPNTYNAIEARYRNERPEWFSDEDKAEDEQPEELMDVPATKADVSDLVHAVDRLSGLASMKQTLDTLNVRAGWIFWFSLGAAIASLRHW